MGIYYLSFDNLLILDAKTTFRKIQHKNHFEFRRLFEELYPRLVAYANEYLFELGSSEDVVQEVFVQLWETGENLNIQTNLQAYLYTMVRNRCLNILRAVKITDFARVLETQAAFDIEYGPDRFSEGENRILYDQVVKMIQCLPRKMRTIVELRFIDNYRYKEIADELGVSVNTVKTQLKRAKIKFGELLVSFIFPLTMLL